MAWRVVWGRGVTAQRFSERRALRRVDFPMLGAPMRERKPERWGVEVALEGSGVVRRFG